MHIFCLETQPNFTPCSSVPLSARPTPAAQKSQGHPSITPCVRAQNALSAGISSWCLHSRAWDTGILCKRIYSETSENFQESNSISLLHTTLFTEIKSPGWWMAFWYRRIANSGDSYFTFRYLSKALVCVALWNEWSLPDLRLDYSSPFWWVFY